MCLYTHTHTCTHIPHTHCTHTAHILHNTCTPHPHTHCTHIHTHTHCTHAHTHIHTHHTHAHTLHTYTLHTCIYTLMHIHTYTLHTCTSTHIAHMHTHCTHTHSCTYTHAHTHGTHAHTHSCTYTHTHTHCTHAYTHSCTYTHTHTHCTHAHTPCTHAHTHGTQVDRDTVTFIFEMKSCREHSTPDKAMWGFSCTVRPQEATDTSPTGLPFLTDIYLSLTSVCCSLIGQLYSGPPPSLEEKACQELLSSELLQCCVWPMDEESVDKLPLDAQTAPIPSPTHHTNLPPKVLLQLRSLADKPRPTLRPSTQKILKVDLLEDLIVSVCLKQHGASSALQLLARQEEGENKNDKVKMEGWKELLGQVFARINSLERRLQLIAELESSWWNDLDDLVSGTLSSVSECFFQGMLHQEGSLKSLELLCCVRGVVVNHSDTLATVRLLQEQMEIDVERRSRRKGTDTKEEGEAAGTTPVVRCRLCEGACYVVSEGFFSLIPPLSKPLSKCSHFAKILPLFLNFPLLKISPSLKMSPFAQNVPPSSKCFLQNACPLCTYIYLL